MALCGEQPTTVVYVTKSEYFLGHYFFAEESIIVSFAYLMYVCKQRYRKKLNALT